MNLRNPSEFSRDPGQSSVNQRHHGERKEKDRIHDNGCAEQNWLIDVKEARYNSHFTSGTQMSQAAKL